MGATKEYMPSCTRKNQWSQGLLHMTPKLDDRIIMQLPDFTFFTQYERPFRMVKIGSHLATLLLRYIMRSTSELDSPIRSFPILIFIRTGRPPPPRGPHDGMFWPPMDLWGPQDTEWLNAHRPTNNIREIRTFKSLQWIQENLRFNIVSKKHCCASLFWSTRRCFQPPRSSYSGSKRSLARQSWLRRGMLLLRIVLRPAGPDRHRRTYKPGHHVPLSSRVLISVYIPCRRRELLSIRDGDTQLLTHISHLHPASRYCAYVSLFYLRCPPTTGFGCVFRQRRSVTVDSCYSSEHSTRSSLGWPMGTRCGIGG